METCWISSPSCVDFAFDVWSSMFTFGFFCKLCFVSFCPFAALKSFFVYLPVKKKSLEKSSAVFLNVELWNEEAYDNILLAHEGRATLRMIEAVVSHTDCKVKATPHFTINGELLQHLFYIYSRLSVYSRQHFTTQVKSNKSNQKVQIINYF